MPRELTKINVRVLIIELLASIFQGISIQLLGYFKIQNANFLKNLEE